MRLGLWLMVGMLAGTGCVAKADPVTYPVQGASGSFSGTGTLTATSNGDGSYTITGISGTYVTGLLGTGAFDGNDNQLYPSASSLVDANGFAFTAQQDDTDFQVDIASTANGYQAQILDSDGVSLEVPVSFSLQSSNGVNSTKSLFRAAVLASSARTFTAS